MHKNDRAGNTTATPPGGDRVGQRIAKVLANAGVCSRRQAEVFIGEKRVTLNGDTVTTPTTFVSPGDDLRFDGEAVKIPTSATKPRLWLYHKPRGALVTESDPQGRPTIFEMIPKELPRLVSVGRLDFNSEGLLLLTTDGGLARAYELPSTGWKRTYRVRVHGRVQEESLQRLRKGMVVDGVRYRSIEAVLDTVKAGAKKRESRANTWLTMTLKEGKNREIRIVMEALGHPVSRLIRTKYGPYALRDLPVNTLVEATAKIPS